MKRGNKSFIPLKDVMEDLFASSVLPINLDDAKIWQVWDGVVGKKVAKHAWPSQINKGVLIIKVTDSVWLHELEFMAETIREGINRALKRTAVKKIRFKVGVPQETKEVRKGKTEQVPDPTSAPEKQKEMNKILSRVKDKELRSSLRQFMTVAAKKVPEERSE
jgi:hypothetical protein